MTELVLARHGQTAWNTEEVFRGRRDIDLDETGLKQAELLADWLSRREIEAVYSSPLRRALKTAYAIGSRHGLQTVVDERLNDLSFGGWEGLSLAEVRRRNPELLTQWLQAPHQVQIPGGEHLDAVSDRVKALIGETARRHAGTVVLVSHRVAHKLIILALLGLDNSHFWNIKLDTAAITTFRSEPAGWVLTAHNETCHLQSLRASAAHDF